MVDDNQPIQGNRLPQLFPIYVQESEDNHPWSNLVLILENLFPVKFNFTDEATSETAAEIRIASGRARSSRPGNPGSIKIPPLKGGSVTTGELVDITVRFADDPDVPFPFRSRTLQSKVRSKPVKLLLRGHERILATNEGDPVWIVSEAGGVKHFESAFTLPWVGPDTGLKDILNEGCFLEILPLISWLREKCKKTAYAGPLLRACFIFDDPNLHWTRYGFVDFRKMATRAAKENYHVAFATIPLDAWFAHEATSQVFRNNTERLSLVVHGNNHTKQELAQRYSPSARVSLLKQAVHRIESLERKARLPVCRIMVPPHGACSEEMLEELPGSGFEAACISHGSLRTHNKGKAWTRTVGYLPSELIHGCPVLPRWGLTGEVKNAVLLAAFLGQPMVLRGHHQDLRNGIELLDELAGFINQLGLVSWANMTELCRMNYQWRLDGNIFRVKLLGRKIVIRVPDQAVQMVIEAGVQRDWEISGKNGADFRARTGEHVALPEAMNREILITPTAPLAARSQNGSNRTPVMALARRLLTEGRDRLLPLSRIH